MELIDHCNATLRRIPDWAKVRATVVSEASAIGPGATVVSLSRAKRSHRGIGRHRNITTLFAWAVDQSYLDEIGELEELDYLWLGWPVTAKDLSPLMKLKRLTFLKLDSPRTVTDFTRLTRLDALSHLFIENAKHLPGVEWLLPLKNKLSALGIEGSIMTQQKVRTLSPLAGFSFQSLFMTSVQLADKDLTPLSKCPNLTYLDCARFAPKKSFEALKALRPGIACKWFDRYEISI